MDAPDRCNALHNISTGLAVSGGGGGAWRDATQAWGVLFNMKSGGLLRLPVGGSSWAAIVKGDSISGIGNACVGEVDLDAHWPVHEKRRAGWYRPVCFFAPCYLQPLDCAGSGDKVGGETWDRVELAARLS